MQRMGMVIGVKPEAIAEYKRLHASGSAEVNALLGPRCEELFDLSARAGEPALRLLGISWRRLAGRSARLDKEPAIRAWLAQTDPCQQPLASAKEGEWWSLMEEVFHLD